MACVILLLPHIQWALMAILDLKTNTKVTVILPEIGRDKAGTGRPNTVSRRDHL